MNTNVQSLKELYIKMGGSLTDTYEGIADGAAVGNYVTIADMIQAVAQKAGSGGGSALPDVSGADNGDVLTVVEGTWAKAAPAKEIDGVAFVYNEEKPLFPDCTKTAAQIYQMSLGDQVITAQYHDENGVNQRLWQLHCKRTGSGNYEYDIVFSGAYAERAVDGFDVTILNIYWDNTESDWRLDNATFNTANLLPAVTGSDNGDVLTVVEGAWAKAAPAAELPAVTGSDNGKVLGVENGAWGAVMPEKVKVIGSTYNSADFNIALDVTVNQLYNLLNDGYVVLIKGYMLESEYQGSTVNTYYSLRLGGFAKGQTNATVSVIEYDGSAELQYSAEVDSADFSRPIIVASQ